MSKKYISHVPEFDIHSSIMFCHITPSHLIPLMGKAYSGPFMALAHLAEGDEFYRKAVHMLPPETYKYLDNSMYELGESMELSKLLKIGEDIGAHCIIEPDGSRGALIESIHDAGFDAMVVPTDDMVVEIRRLIEDDMCDFVGVSFNNAFNYCVGAGLLANDESFKPLARKLVLDLVFNEYTPKKFKKIHLLGATTIEEVKELRKYSKHVCTWDTSMAVWSGVNDVAVCDLHEKNSHPVNFNDKTMFNFMSAFNIGYLEGIVGVIDGE